jgi:hypothetical protein
MDMTRVDSAIIRSININDCLRPNLNDFKNSIYPDYAKGWEDRRQLTGGNKALWGNWIVTYGNPKQGNSVVTEVKDEADWLRLQSMLRQMRHLGDKKCFTLSIDALYHTFDRPHTPPSTEPKAGKSHPKTARPTPLQDPFMAPSSDDNPDSNTEAQDNRLARDSTTNRQLVEQRAINSADSHKVVVKKQIFAIHLCSESRCPNNKGCCYKLPSTGNHHKVSIDEQLEWAAHIVAATPHVTLNSPPINWIKNYGEGYAQQHFKRQGNRKSDPSTRAIAPIVDPIVSATPAITAQPVQVIFQGPPHQQFYGEQPGGNMHYGIPQNPQFHGQTRPIQRQSQVLIPSSPLRTTASGNDDPMPDFSDHLLRDVTNPNRRQAIEQAIRTINDEFLIIEQLKTPAGVRSLIDAGVKSGIALWVQQQATVFTRHQKQLRDAQEALLALSNGHQPPERQQYPQYPQQPQFYGGGGLAR